MSINVKNLTFIYSKKTPNEHVALRDISLDIPDHAFLGIVGETGSGKSTLIQHLNALLIPDIGEIKVDEFLLTPNKRKNKNIKKLRKHVGVVFQFPEYQLFEETVLKDVAFGPKNFGMKESDALEIAKKALKAVNIKEEYFEKSPFELSGGEKRRVAIAGILALEPDILVLDEPTAGLDPTGVNDIMSLIDELYNQGKSIIIVTHDMDILLKHCHDVVVLKDGQITYKGKPNNLFESIDESSSIEIPMLYQFINKLKAKGIDIDVSKIKDIDDLIKVIKEKVKNNG